MPDTVEVEEDDLRKLLKTYFSAADLFDEIVELYDKGHMGKACQYIGAELEGGMENLHEIEENNEEIRDMINTLLDPNREDDLTKMEEMEKEIFGEIVGDEEDL